MDSLFLDMGKESDSNRSMKNYTLKPVEVKKFLVWVIGFYPDGFNLKFIVMSEARISDFVRNSFRSYLHYLIAFF